MKQPPPEVSFDPNARMTENGYALTSGSVEDLARIGLTPEQAVGLAFTFNGGDDSAEGEEPVEIVFNGTVEKHPKWGYLAVSNSQGIYWPNNSFKPTTTSWWRLNSGVRPRS